MKVLLLCKYSELGASSRVRYLQYLPEFRRHGWDVEVHPLFSNAYIQALYSSKSRLFETLKGYLSRLLVLLRAHTFDVLIIEKELFPFLPALFERTLSRMQIPYIADYDDAQFHRYDMNSSIIIRSFLSQKIDAVMKNASLVLAGNRYLYERAQNADARQVEIIPTAVDTERYFPKVSEGGEFTIVGWIGTPQTSRYLIPLLAIFERLKQRWPARFVAVGARAQDFENSPIEVWPWSESTEVELIQQFDIGIMPLSDTPWERGKCAYKLIQCMACAKPVVASPVGVNKEVISPGVNGLLASTPEQWETFLTQLLGDAEMRLQMGNQGRSIVLERFSVRTQAPRLISAIENSVKLA